MRSVLLLTICIMVMLTVSQAFAAADGFYVLSSTPYTWDGTDDYVSAYGDESTVTYTLPASFGSFPFYGQTYTQITADTNGNIWFGATGSAHSFNLASNGRGPVIAAWNNDLSSYYYGGVFIQHKTDPERVVVAWQTETYTNEGLNMPNSFEVVLYPSGQFRLDYQSFAATTTNKDFGSGSSNNGNDHISVTTGYGNVHALAGKSYLFNPQSGPAAQISLGFPGNGTGSVTSIPEGLICTANCNASFKTGTTVTVSATASPGTLFTGWTGGGCSTASSCDINLTAPTDITASFIIIPTVDSTYSLSSSSAPSLATFTDISTNATSWSWNFGDGTTSSLRNPTHVYKTPGSYTVTHSASNAGVSASAPPKNITLTACASQPVKVGSTYYAGLQAAYDAAAAGELIQTLATGLTESLQANRNVDVTIEGGYLCGFPANPPGETTISGMSQIDDGTVRVTNIVVQE